MADFSPGSRPGARALPRKALSRTRLLRSFGYAFAGVRRAWREEPNFRIEAFLGALASALSLWLEVSPVPVLLASALVLALELVNTALETALDRLSPDIHPLVRDAKDAAAGAILVAAMLALLVGLYHLGPPLLGRLSAWL